MKLRKAQARLEERRKKYVRDQQQAGMGSKAYKMMHAPGSMSGRK